MSRPMFGATSATALWNDGPVEGAFALSDAGVVTAVARPWLFGFAAGAAAGPAMLVLGGGGYTQLMVQKEGVAVARWLNTLGIHAYVLVHRFPTAQTGPLASRADAIRAMAMIRAAGHSRVGVVGLSSGGHLAACLLAEGAAVARPDVAVIGYGPISTNATGRTIVADKPPLPPVEKQAMYDLLQPDAQLADAPPPVFIVYSRNDPVVPVANAYRLNDAIVAKGGAAELHIFADAPHGFALDTREGPVRLWPDLCAAWLQQTGFAA